jgi:DNA-binding NarL/FixJ family response regulator
MVVQPLSSIRILITDDYADWRQQVRLLLLKVQPEWQAISESSDGLEAVQKAQDLKPDIILLDIGLPKLNGIEAARRIRQVCPNSKIIFLSQNNDPDVVRAALDTGALGYVHKMDAGRELLLAVDAVLRGKQFISGSLKGHEFSDTARERPPYRHEVLFYSDDTVLLDRLTRFIATALKAGKAAIVLVTKARADSLLQRLRAGGVDTDGAIQEGTFILQDVAKTLPTFMVKDIPDAARFFEVVSGLMDAAAKAAKHSRVVACGECSPLLLAEGKPDAAIRIEHITNDLAKRHNADILCAYPLSSFHGEEDERVFQSICAEHSAVHSQ